MKKEDLEASIEATLAGLKDFQLATVEVVHKRLFPENQKSMLIADEVGLGKTIVAKGVIAKEIKRRMVEGNDLPLKVTYICSNQVIAGENVKKLNVFRDQQVINHLARRIAYLAHKPEVKDEDAEQLLSLNTLTPGTSFTMSSRTGTMYERRIIYTLLCMNPDFCKRHNGLSCLLMGPVRRTVKEWRTWLKEARNQPMRDGLAKKLVELMQNHEVPFSCNSVRKVIGATGKLTLHAVTLELASLLRSNNRQFYIEACYEIIQELRRSLNKACLEYLDADLYIMDEFQRFSGLIDSESLDEEAIIARDIFGKKKAKVLLLSATPFKAFTGDIDEAQGEDHYKDFKQVLKFLAGKESPGLLEYEKHRSALFGQLLNLKKGAKNLSLEHRQAVEQFLRQYICRTERQSVSTDPSSMIEDVWIDAPLRVSRADIENYVATDQIAAALASTESGKAHMIRNPVEYCKSAPYPFSYLDGYMLKKLLDKERGNKRVVRAIHKNAAAWLNMNKVNSYKLQVGRPNGDNLAHFVTHARINQLIDHAVGEKGASLLWMPPSLPYYPLAGVYQGTDGFSKTLVFSSWVMVPRALATLVSYEVERRTVGSPSPEEAEHEKEARTYFDPGTKENYSRHPASLLNFSRSKDEGELSALNMTNFCLLYPSPTLAGLTSSLNLLSDERSLEQVRLSLASELKSLMGAADIEQYVSPGGTSEKWYWALPLLLDRASPQTYNLVKEWMGNSAFRDSDFFKARGKVSMARLEHFDALVQAIDDPHSIGLGAIPSDICDVLADAILGSPAVTAIRCIAKAYGVTEHSLTINELSDAALVANAFVSLYNKPESITAIRLNGGDGPFWKQALRYGADGCLQAVLDEYMHLLQGQVGNRTEVIKSLMDTVSITTSSVNVDGNDSFLEGVPKKMRCHYAVEFGNQRIETDEGQARASNIRANFNSPFRPFMLATTSIGQEGLDFHQYCRRIVHWNLPGNPIDLEQREGRINRYKGLVVRQELAHRYRKELVESSLDGDPWNALFGLADQKERVDVDKCELVPYWHIDTVKYMIERIVPMYPFSSDQVKLNRILKTLAVYRLAFGQPRQVELVDHLLSREFSPQEVRDICEKLMINLSPVIYNERKGVGTESI